MGESDVARFFKALSEDEELAREYAATIGGAAGSTVWPVITELAARHGFAFSAAELGKWLEQSQAELSDEQLDRVAGGIGAGSWVKGGLGSFSSGAFGTVVIGAATDDGGSGSRHLISP